MNSLGSAASLGELRPEDGSQLAIEHIPSGSDLEPDPQVPGPMNQLPDTDPRRIRFDRLHATSTALMTVNIMLGLILLYWYARE